MYVRNQSGARIGCRRRVKCNHGSKSFLHLHQPRTGAAEEGGEREGERGYTYIYVSVGCSQCLGNLSPQIYLPIVSTCRSEFTWPIMFHCSPLRFRDDKGTNTTISSGSNLRSSLLADQVHKPDYVNPGRSFQI